MGGSRSVVQQSKSQVASSFVPLAKPALSCAESRTLSAPSDGLEEAADRAADNVMHGTHARVGAAAASSSVQREASGASSPSLNLGTHVRRALGGGGTPLISSARSFMERGFQTD